MINVYDYVWPMPKYDKPGWFDKIKSKIRAYRLKRSIKKIIVEVDQVMKDHNGNR